MKRSLPTAIAALVAVVTLVAGLVVADPTSAPSRADDAAAPGPRGPGADPLGPGDLLPDLPALVDRPVRNAIVFLVDDMSDFSCGDTSAFLPDSSRWLSDRGTCYENATTATPVCCPARAQVQTGQLPHNNQVRTQHDAFRLDPTDTVQHDLSQAGVRTYGVGKNLNGVNAADYYGPFPVDTGFDRFDFWNSYKHGPGEFTMYADDGTPYRPDDGLYSVEQNGRLVDEELDNAMVSGQRFFVYDAFFAPHKQGPGTSSASLPLPTPANAYATVPPFRFAPEVDARDKQSLFRHQRRTRSYYQRLWTQRIRTLYDVDDQMAATFQRLEDSGLLDETAVIFASDNGYTDRGQVNWEGKAIPYPSSTNIPMLAYYPGRAAAVVDRGVQLVDVAATVYDVMDVAPGHQLDGHSLLDDHRRTNFYGEFFGERDAIALAESGKVVGWVKSWRVLKQGKWSYVEWFRDDGRLHSRELYADPAMLRNVLWRGYRGKRPSKALLRHFHQKMTRLSRCAGTVEGGAPNPCP